MAIDISLTQHPLNPPAPAFQADCGAVVDFWGVVRGLESGAPIAAIDYEAHEAMARHQLQILAEETVTRFPVHALILHHRIGLVPVSEPSLFVRVQTAHRQAALDAVEWLIDELKKRVPIWKKPLAGMAK